MSPAVLAILAARLYLVFYRFYAKGVLIAVRIRREQEDQTV